MISTKFRRAGGEPLDYHVVKTVQEPGAATEYAVRMRDGVRLATDVYIPGGDEIRRPAILIRLPYDKRGDYCFIPLIAEYFVAHGYIVIAQDVRGKFGSEGESLPLLNEVYDGYDTIEWAVHQPWSDGNVGMWGESYHGFTQLAAASSAHPALKAIVPCRTGRGLIDLPVRQDGERTTEVEMQLTRVYSLTFFQSNDTFEWEADWTRPYAAVAERWFETIGERSPGYDLLTPNPVKPRRFPAGDPFDAPAIPTLQTIGWWDNCAKWQWPDHDHIATRPAWAATEFLLIEPRDHEGYLYTGKPYGPEDDHFVNPEALRRLVAEFCEPAVEFYDVFLRRQGTSNDIPRVRWRVAGEAEFRTSPSWPPPGADRLDLYLVAGRLRTESSSQLEEATWVHDPDDLVPSPCETSFAFLKDFGDEAYLAERDDVLVFETAPTEAPVTLAGPVELVATVRSSGPEADFFARLTDLAPDGSAHLIVQGQRTLFEAQDPYRLTVPMDHAGYVLQKGHAFRLTIASSEAGDYVSAPGTGEHRWLAVETCRTEQSIALGGDEGAVLRLTRLVN